MAVASSSSVVFAGLSMAAMGLTGRLAASHLPKTFQMVTKSNPWVNASRAWNMAKYYKGGFEPRMTRREAGLILGISPSSSAARIREVHKRVMLANHPDRGGSQYMAIKINEAKEVLAARK